MHAERRTLAESYRPLSGEVIWLSSVDGGDGAGEYGAVRKWLLVGGVALIGVVAALVVVADGRSVTFKYVTVALTPTGPSPRTVTRSASPLVFLDFVNTDSVAHRVVFAGKHCSIDVPPGQALEGGYECHDGGPTRVGTYHYTVDGTFSGTVRVVGVFRSVTLTATAHTIRLGSRVQLLGQLTIGNEGGPFCAQDRGDLMLLLARHASSQPFKRIAMFPVAGKPLSKKAVNDRCAYSWQRKVQPGLATTYIARTAGHLIDMRRATSRPLTVQVRP